MPIFSYKALDYSGKKTTGLISAFNKRAAEENLRERGFRTIYVKDKTGSPLVKILILINPIKTKDLVIFSRQFSVMVSANLTIVQALKISAEQSENLVLKMIISEIAKEVDSGSSLSSAFLKRPKVFSSFFANVVRSGETSGKLNEVFSYLADEMEKDYDMTSKIKGAMIYPIFVFVGLVIVGAIMMIMVVPKLIEIFKETGTALPLATRIVMGISDFLVGYWWMLLILAALAIIGYRIFVNTKKGRRIVDFFKLKIPVFGKLFRLIYIVRFTRSMHTLLAGGVTVARSLEIVSQVVGNSVYRELIEKSKEDVEEGESFSRAFLRSSEVPKMIPQMIVVGEKTGKLDVVLKKVTDFYNREITNILNNLVSLLEPFIMVIMGVAVGVMVIAIIMPMYNMAGQF